MNLRQFGLSGRSRAQVLRLLRRRAQASPAATRESLRQRFLAQWREEVDRYPGSSSPVCYRDEFPEY